MQTTSHILMIRPVHFAYNAETAVNNAFQVAGNGIDTQQKALAEFDNFVELLRQQGVDVTVVEDTPVPHTPDSIFPNNWISFHADGTILLYPMYAPNRRKERKPAVLQQIANHFNIRQTIDLTHYESINTFLEGTGSMVLDREHLIAYACRSPRTNTDILADFCKRMGYKSVLFDAVDSNGHPIYHTNVMMCVAENYVVICLEAILNPLQKERVMESIQRSGKITIPISLQQMNDFAGNMLQVENTNRETLLVMSTRAYNALTPEQITQLEKYNPIVHAPLTTIEISGGGSARCMMAEIHLPAKSMGGEW